MYRTWLPPLGHSLPQQLPLNLSVNWREPIHRGRGPNAGAVVP